ncbi:rolling pebbles-like protein [Colletotrichum chrysophilum]|uniref:Rolling pebbles-like protein n=1 Tax=Colletotrichum chrysophilum TaxID=1836956 RepID=A0AAD9EML9_9PEZI|nr:rolling pebbles-like protein [Colletotrichum chrysophilum]
MPSPVGGGRNSSPFSLARLATQAGGASSSANPSPVQVNVHGGSSAAESPVSIGALAHQSTRTHLDTEWESMKKEIKYLYLDEDMPLQDVVSVLSKENGFHTNVRMCKTRLKRWGFTKNNSKNRKSSFRNETRPVKSRGIFKRFADRLQNQNGARFPVARSTNNVEDARSTSIFDPTFSLNHVSPFGDNTAHSAVATISELDTTSHGSSGYCEVEKMLVDELPWKGILDVSDPIPVPSYELTCPYCFGEKRFRCIQDHDNGPTSEWDSLGFGSDINLSSPKPCTSNCMCRTLDPAYSFSFLVRMSRYGMSVKFFSDALWAEVVNALPRCHKPRGDDRMVEGQVLFQCREHLTMRSQTIYSEQLSGLAQSGNQSLWLELELLLHGLFDHPAFRQHQTHARQNDQREEECSSPDTPSDVSTPRSAVSLGSSLLKSFNPWRKLRAQWKNRRGQNRLEDKINKLDEVFRNEWLQYEVSPTSSNESETIWMNGNLQVEIAEMADTSIVHHQLSSHVTTSPMQELDGSLTQRYELYSEASSSVLSNTDGSPVYEQHQMDLDTEYNTSYDGSGTEVSPLESFFDGEICELNSRELRTREEFELSKAKNTEHRPFTVRDTNVSPTMAKKLCCVIPSLTDRAMNAARTEDSDFVQALLEFLKDHDGMSCKDSTAIITAKLLTWHVKVWDGSSQGSLMSVAAQAGNLQVVRALLERGDDINQTDRRGVPPIYAAAARGHVEVVSLLLQHGATVNNDSGQHPHSLLGVSAANGAHEVVRLLLNQYHSPTRNKRMDLGNSSLVCRQKDMDEALVLAAKSGSSATMEVLLDYGADVDLLLQTPASELTSALIESAALGNYKVVNILLLTRVDVRSLDHRGTPLSAAISNGHYAVARLLLKHSGGQVLVALQHLRSCGKRHQIGRLFKIVSQTQKQPHLGNTLPETGLVTTSMECLRKHFLLQHSTMLSASSASCTKFLQLSWLYPCQKDTWATAINFMQNLSKGKHPAGVHDTIPFLCLSRAMVDTLHELHLADYKHDFDADVPRWQILFMGGDKTDDLEAYRDAVSSMWGVTFDSHHARDSRDSILKRFRDFAATLADKADRIYSKSPIGIPDLTMSEPIGHALHGSTHENRRQPLDTGELSERQREKLPRKQTTPTSQPEETLGRTATGEIDSDPTLVDSLATFLIASAAFAIVIVYTQDFPSIRTLTQRYDLFESEVVHGIDLVGIEGICGNQYGWV